MLLSVDGIGENRPVRGVTTQCIISALVRRASLCEQEGGFHKPRETKTIQCDSETPHRNGTNVFHKKWMFYR